ncbi:hypothetical protein, partial [Paeniglutamicibacter gangotriensis]|uniref:hypothetical protein n=1 Tax=Paeniglutamicibacter gangotriensis TaxID=254787 RepID=UPI001CB731A7
SPSNAPSGPHGDHWPGARLFPPRKLAETFVIFCQEILHELLPSRRHRNVLRVVKRKMSKWPVKKVTKAK